MAIAIEKRELNKHLFFRHIGLAPSTRFGFPLVTPRSHDSRSCSEASSQFRVAVSTLLIAHTLAPSCVYTRIGTLIGSMFREPYDHLLLILSLISLLCSSLHPPPLCVRIVLFYLSSFNCFPQLVFRISSRS
jgi:hypothetical protein